LGSSPNGARPVYVEFPDFGYGPAAAALALINGVRDAYRWNVVSTGGAAAFAGEQLPEAGHFDLDTFDQGSWKLFEEIAPPGSAIVSVTNPEFGIWAADAGYRVGIVDTLDWMWPALPSGVRQVKFHLVQAYFGNRSSRSRHNRSAEVIRPIVNPLLWPTGGAGPGSGSTVIGFGGMQVPTPGGNELVKRYTRWLLATALPILVRHPKVTTITIVGGRADLEDLVPRRWSKAVQVRPRLPQADYADLLRSADHLLLSPGLGSLYECASTGLQPLLQPGWNLSMLRQAHDVTTTTTYPYVCRWPWLDQALTRVEGQPEHDALRYLTSRIRDAIRKDRSREESMLAEPIRQYLGRDGSAPALQLDGDTSKALPVAASFKERLPRLFEGPHGPERGGGGEPGVDPRQDHPLA
jgi:hypothetical protein